VNDGIILLVAVVTVASVLWLAWIALAWTLDRIRESTKFRRRERRARIEQHRMIVDIHRRMFGYREPASEERREP
jgi:uncharacterized membrane protein YqjE